MATSVLSHHFRFRRRTGSDGEKGLRCHSRNRSHKTNTPSAAASTTEYYREQAEEVWETLWKLLHCNDWKMDKGVVHPENGYVKHRYCKEEGNMFMLQAVVDLEASKLWELLTYGFDESPAWNPTLVHCRTLQTLDDVSCITYSVSSPAVGGLVSSRDFVNVRRWGRRENYYLSAGMSTIYPDMPPQKHIVRGENGSGGWAVKSISGQVNKSELTWICRTNLKGWLPKAVTDKAMHSILLDFLKYLKSHISDLQKNGKL